MSRLPATAFACLALTAGAVAGCGDDNKDTSSAPAPPPPPPAAYSQDKPAASGDVVKVSMKDIKFLPHDVTAKVGQKILWTNDDRTAHTVTATGGADFDSGNVDGGGTYEYTPTKAGKIDYVCTIHSGQDGTITVTR